jgi:hypothetical protein
VGDERVWHLRVTSRSLSLCLKSRDGEHVKSLADDPIILGSQNSNLAWSALDSCATRINSSLRRITSFTKTSVFKFIAPLCRARIAACITKE